jgi:hypothetical protein
VHYHVPYGSEPCLPAEVGSDAATCPMAPDPTSLLGKSLMLPRVARLWTPPPCSRGLRYYHVSHGSRLHIPAREGSGATTCPWLWIPPPCSGGGSGAVMCHVAPYPASLFGRAPVLPRVLWLQTLPPCSGGLRCCHVSHDPQRAAGLKNKERLSWPTYAARLACFYGAPVSFRNARHLSHHGPQDVPPGDTINTYKTCGHVATVPRRPCWLLT